MGTSKTKQKKTPGDKIHYVDNIFLHFDIQLLNMCAYVCACFGELWVKALSKQSAPNPHLQENIFQQTETYKTNIAYK